MSPGGRSPNSSDLPYRAVRAFARFWLWFFFKRVEVRHADRVPADGPVLLAMNHPNNLIDTLLVGSVLRRKVHYLATASLFRNRQLARFLLSMGAIPVYRRQDDPEKMDKNTAAFEACHRVFDAGGVVGIYPEGTTHAERRVQRIKTGTARIALESAARHHGSLHLALIPVGLSFELRKSFRSRVRVSFGEPIPLTAFLALYRDDAWKAVDQLTTRLQEAMEAQVIHVSRLDLSGLIKDIEGLYRGDLIRGLIEERKIARGEIDTFRLSRTIVEAVHHFQEHDPGRVKEIAARIERYKEHLRALRLPDAVLRSRSSRSSLTHHLSLTGIGAVGFPIFAYGALTNGLPYLIPRWLCRRIAKKETDYATTRLLTSVVTFPLFYGLEIFLVWKWLGGPLTALFALSLPLTGLFAYQYLKGVGRLRQQAALLRRVVTQRQAVAKLVAERQLVLDALEQARTDFLKSTRGA